VRVETVARTSLGRKHMRLDPSFYLRRIGLRRLLDEEDTRHVTLTDIVAELHDGARLPTARSGVPLIRLSNLRACELDLVNMGCADPAASWPEVRPGDVLFTRSAVPFRAAVVPPGVPQPLTVSPEITIIRPRAAVVPEYLAALLSTPAYARILEDLAYRRSPTALRRLRLSDIRRLPVPLPRRGLQEEIRITYQAASRLTEDARDEIGRVVGAVHSEIDARLAVPEMTGDSFVILRSELGPRWDVGYARGLLFRNALAERSVMAPLLSLARPVPASLRGINENDAVLVVKANDINESTFLVEGAQPARLGDLSSRMRQPLAIGDVLLCTTGQGEQIAFLDDLIETNDRPILGSATFTALRFFQTPRFYSIALAHPVVRLQLRQLSSGAVQRFVNKRDLDELLLPTLGTVWREDFDTRIQRAMQRRREALSARDRLLEATQHFVQEGWQA